VVVPVTVTPVNDAPTASAPPLTTAEDTPGAGTISASDLDGDSLTYTVTAGPAHGSLVINPDGSFVYTPAANYHGPDSFTVTVSDGNGGVAVQTVTINVLPASTGILPDDGRDEIDPTKPPSRNPDAPTLRVDPAVIEAVEKAGGNFRGLPGIDAKGVVVRTVEGVNSLASMTALDLDRGAISETVAAGGTGQFDVRALGLEAWRNFDTRMFGGYSIVMSDEIQDAGQVAGIVFESLKQRDSLILTVHDLRADPGMSIREFRLAGLDGKPLPPWLSQASRGVYVGVPPANLERLALDVQVILEDGTKLAKTMVIDVETGRISVAAGQGVETPRSLLFSDQFERHAGRGSLDAARLEAALGL
jgi:VCBS repeat-containing protein